MSTQVDDTRTEALIKEARRRTRRRRTARMLTVAAVLAVLAAGAVALSRGGGRHDQAQSEPRAASASHPTGTVVALRDPTALAVSPHGTLYVIDAKRDQVLRLLPSGKFVVFAGSGRHGYSGDGGPATRARLRLNGSSTVAVAGTGTVYIADTGNNRVRAVTPDGAIHTVARVDAPRGLAIGPHGRLYISGSDLYSVSLAGGQPRRIAGWQIKGNLPATAHEVAESHFANTYGDVAADRAGDVYVASFPDLFERTASGKLLALGSYRAGGGPAQLAEGPDGVIYGAAFSIFRLGANGLSDRSQNIVSNRRIDKAVGRDWRRLASGKQPIIGPASGLAITATGDIYYDTDSGNGWASGALVEVTHAGRVRVLWRAPA